mgnify:FL=1
MASGGSPTTYRDESLLKESRTIEPGKAEQVIVETGKEENRQRGQAYGGRCILAPLHVHPSASKLHPG